MKIEPITVSVDVVRAGLTAAKDATAVDAPMIVMPAKEGTRFRRIAGWAATGDLDLQGERIVGQAFTNVQCPYPLTVEGHPGGRVGTVVAAIAEGPMLWIEADVDTESENYPEAERVLGGPTPSFSIGGVITSQSKGALCACDGHGEDAACACIEVNELSGIDLNQVTLTDRPANTSAIVVHKTDRTDRTDSADEAGDTTEIVDEATLTLIDEACASATSEDLRRVVDAANRAVAAWRTVRDEEESA